MAAKVTFTPQDFEGLAAKLDRFGAELNDREHTILTTLFSAGASAIAEEGGEVEGFLLVPAVQKVREAARMQSMGLGSSFLSAVVGNPPGSPPEPTR